jgi:hypothetical protein
MRKFLSTFFYFSLPLIIIGVILLAGYVYFDPFKVLRSYPTYPQTCSATNRDYISTEAYIHNHVKYSYNSFVFGSSRTLAYRTDSWLNYIPATSKPFVFDASAENVFGIYTKLHYLDKLNVKIDNALIILCRDISFLPEDKGMLFIKHPATSGKSWVAFQYPFLNAYFTKKFIYSYYYYMYAKKYMPFMEGYVVPPDADKHIPSAATNQLDFTSTEKEINQNPGLYYARKESVFYQRKGEKTDSIARINKENKRMLSEIKFILDKHKTNYKVVLSPLYEQIKFHPDDVTFLKQTFSSHLFDFSGANQFTNNKENYYESSHYRVAIGDSILSIIYRE